MTQSNDPDQIRREIEQTRAGLASDVSLLEEKVSPGRIVDRRVQRARGAAVGLRDRVMGPAHTTTDHAHNAAGAGSAGLDSAKSSLGSVSDSVTSAPTAITDRTQGNPIAAGLIAFGVGWLVSSVFGASDREQQLAAGLKDTAQPVLTDKAKQIAGDLKEPAQQAVAEVKDAASQASTEVADQAKSATDQVKDHATSAAQDVKQTASS